MKYGTLEILSWRSRSSAKAPAGRTAGGWSKREGHRWLYNNTLPHKKIFLMSCLTEELMWLLTDKTWIVAAETEAGLVLTLFLLCVLELKIPWWLWTPLSWCLPVAAALGACWAAHPSAAAVILADLGILNRSFTGIKDFLYQMLSSMFVCFCLSQP